MLKGEGILKAGVAICAVSLIVSHSIGFYEGFISFAMGLGCGLSFIGAGKRFVENRTNCGKP